MAGMAAAQAFVEGDFPIDEHGEFFTNQRLVAPVPLSRFMAHDFIALKYRECSAD